MTSPAAAPETPDHAWNLLDRAMKMMQMAGYSVSPQDRNHNDPIIAWMADARIYLTEERMPPLRPTQADEVRKLREELTISETSLASLRQEVVRMEHDIERHVQIASNEANARIEETERANRCIQVFGADCDGLRDTIRQLQAGMSAALAAAEADKLDAQRYRYYMGRLFDPKGDWPLEFQDAQSLDELNTAIDTAAAKQGEAG